MVNYLKNAFESIDAAFFSSDLFNNSKSITEIEEYLFRWERQIKTIKEMIQKGELDGK